MSSAGARMAHVEASQERSVRLARTRELRCHLCDSTLWNELSLRNGDIVIASWDVEPAQPVLDDAAGAAGGDQRPAGPGGAADRAPARVDRRLLPRLVRARRLPLLAVLGPCARLVGVPPAAERDAAPLQRAE